MTGKNPVSRRFAAALWTLSALLASAAVQAQAPDFVTGKPYYRRSVDGLLFVTLPLRNRGTGAAAALTVNQISLGAAPRRTPTVLPASLQDVAAGGAAEARASFDCGGLTSGARYLLTVRGTYRAGGQTCGFTVNRYLTLPVAPAPLSDDRRLAVLDAIGAVQDALPGQDINADNQALLAYLRSRPELEDAAISSDLCVWASFLDGQALLLGTNVDDSGGVNRERRAFRPIGFDMSLPTTTQTRVLSGVTSRFADHYTLDSPLYGLDTNGYHIGSQDASVEGLRQVQGDGVFAFTTHGGQFDLRNGGAAFALASASPVTKADLAAYNADLNAGRLCLFRAAFDYDTQALKTRLQWHFGITPKFIDDNHWSFDPHSLIVINGCDSDDPTLKSAFARAGASVYAGWSQPVRVLDAYHAVSFLFDRLLGANAVAPLETPPQRPFDCMSVWLDMQNEKTDTSVSKKTGIPSKLMLTPLQGDFRILAPSIASLGASDINNELTLGGSFGEEPGEVTMGGQSLTVTQWTSGQITCRGLPVPSGEVVVTANGHTSNAVRLTEWQGTFTHTYHGKGTLKQVVTMHIHFRADVHGFRPGLHQAPLEAGELADILRDSTCHYACSGKYVDMSNPDNPVTTVWSGSGDVPLAPATTSRFFTFDVDFGTPNRTGVLSYLGEVNSGYTQTITDRSGTSTSTELLFFASSFVSANGQLSLLPFQRNDGYVIEAGQWSYIDPDYRIEWGDMSPVNPPRPDDAR
jgi:hypothetical protein